MTSSVFTQGLKLTKKVHDASICTPSQASVNDKLTIAHKLQNKKATSLKLQQKYRHFSFDKLKFDSSPPCTPIFQTQDVVSYESETLLGFDDAIIPSPCDVDTEQSSANFAVFRNLPADDLPFPMSQNNPRVSRSQCSTPNSALNSSDSRNMSALNASNDDSSFTRHLNSSDNSISETSLNSEKISPDRKFKEVSNFKKKSPDSLYSQIKPDNAPTTRTAHSRKRKLDEKPDSLLTSRCIRAKLDRSIDSLNEDSDSMFIDVRWRPSSVSQSRDVVCVFQLYTC